MNKTEEIDWSINCFTSGVHHGRPEKIWDLPILHAVTMFSRDQLRELVITRIYNDAKLVAEHSVDPKLSTEDWLPRLKERVEQMYDVLLQQKVGEISNYYKSEMYKRDIDDAIGRLKEDRLNPFFEPRHGHDTLNMLCRIMGMSAFRHTTQ